MCGGDRLWTRAESSKDHALHHQTARPPSAEEEGVRFGLVSPPLALFSLPCSGVLNPRQFCLQGMDVGQSLETFLVTARGGECCRPLVGRGQGCCQTPHNAQDSHPYPRAKNPLGQ